METLLHHKKESTLKVLQVIREILSAQLQKTFGRDNQLVDRDIVEVVLANPENKRKLMERLNNSDKPEFSIVIEGKKLHFKD